MFQHFLIMSVDADNWPCKSIVLQGVAEQQQSWAHMLLKTNELARKALVFRIDDWDTPEPTFKHIGTHEL